MDQADIFIFEAKIRSFVKVMNLSTLDLTIVNMKFTFNYPIGTTRKTQMSKRPLENVRVMSA